MRRPIIPTRPAAPRRLLSASTTLLATALLLLGAASLAAADPAAEPEHACQLTVTAQKGDTCFSLTATWGLSVTTFLNNNPSISSCSKLTVGANYCIDPDPPTPPPGNNQQSNNPADLLVSNDGTCGNGLTCKGSKFGDCCSGHGWCGGTADHCGSECNPAFGLCNGVAAPPANPPSTTTSAAPPANSNPSPPRTTQPARPPQDNGGGTGSLRTLYTTITNVERSTSIVFRTQFATIPVPATVTNTVVATVTTGLIATRTSVVTQTTESVTVRTQTQRVTRTMTQTEIDTSIITTITTMTLVVSQTDGAGQNGDSCSRITRQASAAVPVNDARVPAGTVVNDARIPGATQGALNNSPRVSSSSRFNRMTSARK